MNILNTFVLFAIFLKCVAASEDDVRVAFKAAVEREDFEWLETTFLSWWRRNDLLDYVIEKGADFTIRLIQNVDYAKEHVLAALFDKGEEGTIDEVLERGDYDDGICGI